MRYIGIGQLIQLTHLVWQQGWHIQVPLARDLDLHPTSISVTTTRHPVPHSWRSESICIPYSHSDTLHEAFRCVTGAEQGESAPYTTKKSCQPRSAFHAQSTRQAPSYPAQAVPTSLQPKEKDP